jgi:hypothetical protein
MKSHLLAAPIRSFTLLAVAAAAFVFVVGASVVGASQASAASPYPPSTPSSTPTIVTNAGPGVTPPGPTTSGSTLAFTGAPVITASVVALILLAGGTTVLLLARRRRHA